MKKRSNFSRVWPLLWFVWSTIIIGGVVNIYSSKLAELKDSRLIAYMLIGLSILGSLSLTAYRAWLRQKKEEQFELVVQAKSLKPEDFGFDSTPGRRKPARTLRPYTQSIYIPRSAVAYTDRHKSEFPRTYTEDDLAKALYTGESILVIGKPLEGKTRTLYEVCRRLHDFVIVRPRTDLAPNDDAVELFARKNVLFVLDDLQFYTAAAAEFSKLRDRVEAIAAKVSVVATCQQGSALEQVAFGVSGPIRRIFESFTLKIILNNASDLDKQTLKQAIGEKSDMIFPTLGSICMREAFELMRRRFDGLPNETKDCFRAIILLFSAGVLPIAQRRTMNVLIGVFNRSSVDHARVIDLLVELAGSFFLVSQGDAEPVHPEAAYVSEPESLYYYGRERIPSMDFGKLLDVLETGSDFDGLLLFAIARYSSLQFDEAGAVFRRICTNARALEDPKWIGIVARAHLGQAMVCQEQNQTDAALKLFDKVESIVGDGKDDTACNALAKSLLMKAQIFISNDHRLSEALDTCNRLISRFQFSTNMETRCAVCFAYLLSCVMYARGGRIDSALSYASAIKMHFSESSDTQIRAIVAEAARFSAELQVERDIAIHLHDQVDRKYGDSNETLVAAEVVQSLVQKGRLLAKDDESRSFDCYNEIDARYGNYEEAAIAIHVASALFEKGQLFERGNRTGEAIGCYHEIERRYGVRQELGLRLEVARSRVRAASLYDRLEYQPKAMEYLNCVIEANGDSDNDELRAYSAVAMWTMVSLLEQRGDTAAAYEVLIGLRQKFLSTSDTPLRLCVCEALFKQVEAGDHRDILPMNNLRLLIEGASQESLSHYLARLLILKFHRSDHLGEKTACLAEILQRFSLSDDLLVRREVAMALKLKVLLDEYRGNIDDAINNCAELDRRYGQDEDWDLFSLVWWALKYRAAMYARHNKRSDALISYEETAQRYSSGPEGFRYRAAWALREKAATLAHMNEPAAAIECCDRVIELLEDGLYATSYDDSARATLFKAALLAKMGDLKGALNCHLRFDRQFRYGFAPGNQVRQLLTRSQIRRRRVMRLLETLPSKSQRHESNPSGTA